MNLAPANETHVVKGLTMSTVEPGQRAQVMVQARASSRIDLVTAGDGARVVQVIAGKQRAQAEELETLARVGAGRSVLVIVENATREPRVLEAFVTFADEDVTSTEGAAPSDPLAAPPDAAPGGEGDAEQRPPRNPVIEGLDFEPVVRNLQSDTPSEASPAAESVVDVAMVEGSLRANLHRSHAAELERHLSDGVSVAPVVLTTIAWKLEAATLAPNVPPSDSEISVALDAVDALAVSHAIRGLTEPLGMLLDRDEALRARLARALARSLEPPEARQIPLASEALTA